MANDAESAIYNKLTTAPTFKPSGVRLFTPDWTLEPGDVVTVQSDGVNYPVPIYTMNLEWRNATKVDIQSSGNQTREPLPALRRREYRSGRRGYSAVQQAEETQQQYEHFVDETDAYRVEIYKINGVMFDPDTHEVIYEIVYETDAQGNPIIDPETGEKIPVIDPETGEPMIKRDNAGNPVPVYNEDSDGSIASQVIRSAQEISQKVTQQDVNNSLTGYLQTTAWESRMGNYLETKNGTKVMKSIAEVVTMINNQSEGIVNINGDRVNINATKSASVGNTLYISDGGSFWVKRAAMFGSDTGSAAGKYVTINGGTVNAPNLQVNSEGTLTFSPSSQSDSALTLNRASFAGLVTDVQISGPVNNVYKLQYKKMGTGDSWKDAQVSFSRATTLYKSNYTIDGTNKTAGWSSGTFTVKAEPQGESTSTRLTGIEQSGNITKNSTLPKYVNFPYIINYADDNDNELDTGFRGPGTGNPIATVSVDASLVYTDGQDHMTANGSWGTYNAQDTAENKAKNSFTYQAYTTDSPSTAKGTAKQTDVTLSSGLWIGNKKTVYLKENNNILAEFEVDASSLVPSSAVNVVGPTWDGSTATDSRKVTFSPSSGTGSSAEMTLTLSASASNFTWNSTGTNAGKYTYTVTGNVNDGSGVKLTKTTSGLILTPTNAINYGKSQVGLKTPEWLDSTDDDHPNTYLISTNGRVNSSTGATNEAQSYLTPTDAINYGKTLVGIDTITLGTITANASARTASVRATVLLDNGVSKTGDVDVSTIYQAGLDGGPTITSAPFRVRLVDNNDTYIRTAQKTISVSDIYEKGVQDATPLTFIYDANGNLVNAYSTAKVIPSSSDIYGQLYPNTKVNYIRDVTVSSSIISRTYAECEYYGVTFYVLKTNVHTGTTPDSPSNYGTATGWYSGGSVSYDYNGVVSFDSGNSVTIYSSQSTSSTAVTTVQNEETVQCMYNPNGYAETWMPVKYGNYTGYLESKYIYGTNAWNELHPTVPVLQNVAIEWIVHSVNSYSSDVSMLVDTTTGNITTKTSSAVPQSAYAAITTDSSADKSKYLEYVYRYAYLAYTQTSGFPDSITAKIRLKLTYSGTSEPTYLNLELTSQGERVYQYTSTVYADSGSTVRIRATASSGGSPVTNVPIGATIYCFDNPIGYSYDWMRVKYGQYEGYMMAQYIVGTDKYEETYGGGGSTKEVVGVTVRYIYHKSPTKDFSVFYTPKDGVRERVTSVYNEATYDSLSTTTTSYARFFDELPKHYTASYAGTATHKFVINASFSDGTTESNICFVVNSSP